MRLQSLHQVQVKPCYSVPSVCLSYYCLIHIFQGGPLSWQQTSISISMNKWHSLLASWCCAFHTSDTGEADRGVVLCTDASVQSGDLDEVRAAGVGVETDCVNEEMLLAVLFLSPFTAYINSLTLPPRTPHHTTNETHKSTDIPFPPHYHT